MSERSDHDKLRWILNTGWKGRCPRCGKGAMFQSWLKVADSCDACGLSYRFAAPDDGPAFFSLCLVVPPLLAFALWFHVAVGPPAWVHLLTSVPLMVAGCLMPLRPIKGWLVSSQYVNRAQEAGTQGLWAQLHGRRADDDRSDFDD